MELRIGDKGANVKVLQEALRVEVTGTFDKKTRVAVIGWQSDKALAHTGFVDQQMWEALGCAVIAIPAAIVFDSEAVDGDGDGFVQDGTRYQRPRPGSKKK